MRRILDIMSTRRNEGAAIFLHHVLYLQIHVCTCMCTYFPECSTPRHTEGESLLAKYREVQKQGKCPSHSKNFTPSLKNHMVIYLFVYLPIDAFMCTCTCVYILVHAYAFTRLTFALWSLLRQS